MKEIPEVFRRPSKLRTLKHIFNTVRYIGTVLSVVPTLCINPVLIMTSGLIFLATEIGVPLASFSCFHLAHSASEAESPLSWKMWGGNVTQQKYTPMCMSALFSRHFIAT